MKGDIFKVDHALVIVTGSWRGNGRAVANGFSDQGARVLGVDVAPQNNCQFETLEGDISSDVTIKQIYEFIDSVAPQTLVVVNNAGITLPAAGVYPQDNWDLTLKVNLTAPFKLIEGIKHLFGEKIETGSIINVSSLGAFVAFPNNPAYQASKAGLTQLTRTYARELGASGVRVNNIVPGYIRTDMTAKSFGDPRVRDIREKHTCLRRWGESNDLVGLAIFLASEASSYITGQSIFVDGGWFANGLCFD